MAPLPELLCAFEKILSVRKYIHIHTYVRLDGPLTCPRQIYCFKEKNKPINNIGTNFKLTSLD